MQISRGIIQSAQKVIIYGPEGIGKSTFASKFPNPVFIDTEGSTKHMDVARTPKPTSWTMLLEQVRYFRNEPGACGTLVIDTADWAEQLCTAHICALKQVDSIESIGYGKGYVYLADEFGRLLNLLEEIIERGIHVVITAHAWMRKFEQPDELGGYDRWEMKLGKKTAPLVKEWADMVLFARFKTYVVNIDNQGAQKGKNKAQGGQRVICTAHHPCWDAKNRHRLADELPFDYAQLAHCFDIAVSSIVAPTPSPTPPPTAMTETPAAQTPLQSMVIETPAAPPEQTKLVAIPEPVTPMAAQRYTGEFPPTTENPIRAVPPLDSNIPKSLRDLMEENLVTEDEIQQAVASRGYYPSDTPIKNYDPQFVTSVLIAAWPQIFNFIKENVRDLPF